MQSRRGRFMQQAPNNRHRAVTRRLEWSWAHPGDFSQAQVGSLLCGSQDQEVGHVEGPGYVHEVLELVLSRLLHHARWIIDDTTQP